MSATLLLVLVALAAVFACLAIVSSRKCAAALSQARELVSALRSARSKIETHDAELEAVTDALHQLRGKFYAERRKYTQQVNQEDSAQLPADVASIKAMLRRKAGIIPGRPANHSEARE